MIAYNREWLRNILVLEEAEIAFGEGLLHREELGRIAGKYPAGFYTPNLFIRVGLFILTVIIAFFSFGLISLFFIEAVDNSMGILAIFFGMVAYGALELMVKNKHHYRSGVDDALLWMAALLVFTGISLLTGAGELFSCVLSFLIAVYCMLRFTDRLMAIVAFISLAGIFFFLFSRSGSLKAAVPFMMMALSAIVYFFSTRLQRMKPAFSTALYHECLRVITIVALAWFYLAGNYYVVRELSNAMFGLNLTERDSIPLGWLFCIFTFATPALYLARGIQKKDRVLIRMGLLLVVLIVLTAKYYFYIASAELMMVVSGIVLLVISWLLTRYLRTPKYGFTYLEISEHEDREKAQVEALVLAETFSGTQTTIEGTKFGGGSFGGAGSGGEF